MNLYAHILAPAALFFVLAACSPKPEEPSPSPAPVTVVTDAETGPDEPVENVFIGTWRLESSQVAPWWSGAGAAPAANPELATTPLVISEVSVAGPSIAACGAPAYRIAQYPVESLFEGNLPDPWSMAKELGISGQYVTTLVESCTENGRDVELQFPMVDANTLLLGLDNMIYTFERQPG